MKRSGKSKQSSSLSSHFYFVTISFIFAISFFGLITIAHKSFSHANETKSFELGDGGLRMEPKQKDSSYKSARLRIENQQTIGTTLSNSGRPPTTPPSFPPTPHQTRANIASQISPQDKISELFQLGQRSPVELNRVLENEDPFGVAAGPGGDFMCPDVDQRIDFPTLAKEANARMFREGAADSFILYQHLRKAGGTGFCDLANSNMPTSAVPGYYCMPDNKGSLATPPWRDREYFLNHMKAKHFKIAANEWDAFYSEFIDFPGAVLATTFRHPIDRWFSQYRFEHLEHRDGSAPDAPRNPFLKWYNNNKGWTMGTNYYVKTFIGTADKSPPLNTGDFYWTYHKFQRTVITWELFQQSLLHVRKFHLLLVTEWLDASTPLIEGVLGWHVPPKQVLPHESQAVRTVKKSLTAKESVPPADYQVMVEENIFDILMFHIVRRIFLERLACQTSNGVWS